MDQFGESTATVRAPQRLCNPADKAGSGIVDPTAHALCYGIKERPFIRHRVLVRDQFGEHRLTTWRAEQLCNPAEKDMVPSAAVMNHFKCYRVLPTPGGDRFGGAEVMVTDQFEQKQTLVLRPHLLCNPTEKNGEPIVDPACHLLCYRITDAPGEPDFTPRDVTVVDQFAESDLRTIRGTCRQASVLCVPAEKEELD